MSINSDNYVNRRGDKTGVSRFVYTHEERELLRNLVVRHRAIIENHQTDNPSKRAKDSAWETLAEEYNSQPGIRRVTVMQLRKLWDNAKLKWKKKDSEEKRDLYATEGGPPTCRPMSPSLALVGAAASHIGTRLPNEYDSDGAHTNQPVLSLPPARIFEVMVSGNQDSMDEWLGEARFAAIERVLAPEGAARLKALQKDEERKGELHSVEMRLRRQQLLQQRQRHWMDEQRKPELHQIEVQLRQQQLEQQKWRDDVERQMLFLELEAKKKQLA
nr:myb/SANT-like DNA-binding domain-containing protein 3 [Dermacentor andersoni]